MIYIRNICQVAFHLLGFVSIQNTFKNSYFVSSAKESNVPNEQKSTSPIQKFQKIIESLHAFLGFNPSFVKNFKLKNDSSKIIIEGVIERYTHFEAAQIGIIQFVDDLVLKDLKINEKHCKVKDEMYSVLFITFYNEVMQLFHTSFSILISCYTKLFNPEMSECFIPALTILLKDVCTKTYLFTSCDAEFYLYSVNNLNVMPINQRKINSLIAKSFNKAMEANYIYYIEILTLAFRWETCFIMTINFPKKNNVIELAHETMKNIEFNTKTLRKVLAMKLNKLLVNIFNHAGVKILENGKCIELIFYDEKLDIARIANIENLEFDDYKKINECYSITDMCDLYKHDDLVFISYYKFLPLFCRKRIIAFIFETIIHSSANTEYKKIRVIGEFSFKIYNRYKSSVLYASDLLSGKITEFIKNCDVKYQTYVELFNLRYLQYFCTKVLEHGSYTNKLCIISDITSITKCNTTTDSDVLVILKNMLKLYFNLVDKYITNCEAFQNSSALYFHWFAIHKNIIELCKSYNILGNQNIIRIIFRYIINISIKGLIYYKTEDGLELIENLLCDSEHRLLFPADGFIKTNPLASICKIYADNYKNGICLRKRIGNIALKCFFIIIGLHVELKNNALNKENSENLDCVINYFQNRKYDMLKFEFIPNESLVAEYNSSWSLIYYDLIESLILCNIESGDKNLDMIILDALEIRLRLSPDFTGLLKSNAYYFLLESQPTSKIIYDYGIFSSNQYNNFYIRDKYCEFFLEDRFSNLIIIESKSTYDLIMSLTFNITCAFKRFDYVQSIDYHRLDKISQEFKDLNEVFDNFECSILRLEINECKFFYEILKILYNALLRPLLYEGLLVDYFKTNFFIYLFQIQNKLQELLLENKKYKESYAIDFYFIKSCSFFKIIDLENITSFNIINMRLRKIFPCYFNFLWKVNKKVSTWIDVLFHQLLTLLNMSITDSDINGTIRLSLSPLYNFVMNKYIQYEFTHISVTDVRYNRYNFFESDPSDFINMLIVFLIDFPELAKFVLHILLNKLESTINYSESCNLLCYSMYLKIQYDCNIDMKFASSDNLFATHIANCLYKGFFMVLCDILKEYIKEECRKNNTYEYKTLISFNAAIYKAKATKWKHDILSRDFITYLKAVV